MLNDQPKTALILGVAIIRRDLELFNTAAQCLGQLRPSEMRKIYNRISFLLTAEDKEWLANQYACA